MLYWKKEIYIQITIMGLLKKTEKLVLYINSANILVLLFIFYKINRCILCHLLLLKYIIIIYHQHLPFWIISYPAVQMFLMKLTNDKLMNWNKWERQTFSFHFYNMCFSWRMVCWRNGHKYYMIWCIFNEASITL